jgi:hypothetical protein
MYFPDGTVKEGTFDNNVFRGVDEFPISPIPTPPKTHMSPKSTRGTDLKRRLAN